MMPEQQGSTARPQQCRSACPGQAGAQARLMPNGLHAEKSLEHEAHMGAQRQARGSGHVGGHGGHRGGAGQAQGDISGGTSKGEHMRYTGRSNLVAEGTYKGHTSRAPAAPRRCPTAPARGQHGRRWHTDSRAHQPACGSGHRAKQKLRCVSIVNT